MAGAGLHLQRGEELFVGARSVRTMREFCRTKQLIAP